MCLRYTDRRCGGMIVRRNLASHPRMAWIYCAGQNQ
ncbi:hypothetical protein X548_18365 [Stenotrophomonas maltophilia 5BA-I-2]|nr:hypothetical protein X548_18365 [Stenotrophomonas maltophilia 5BA-I-2]